jgi:hypothetical protein
MKKAKKAVKKMASRKAGTKKKTVNAPFRPWPEPGGPLSGGRSAPSAYSKDDAFPRPGNGGGGFKGD